MRRLACVSVLFASTVIAAPAANAAVSLLAVGDLTGSSAGSYADLSGLSGPLENGLRGDLLGGLGSGLAYAGGNTFLALPDRGPNAKPYNSNLDDTVSYINRFHTVRLALTPSSSGSLPFSLTPKLTKTTLLYSPTALDYGTGAGLGNDINGNPIGNGAPSLNTANQFYFTGRSDNFGPGNSGNAADARFDTESIRVSNNGKDVFISDEYGPYVREFDKSTGALVKTFTLPSNLYVSNLSPQGSVEISGNTSGRTANKGMEGLSITPDGKTLVGIVQAALIQDAASSVSKKILRIVTIDIATGTTHEYGYKLTVGSGVSDIVAINDHQFLVDERDGSGLGSGTPNDPAVTKQIFKIDITGAQDITAFSGAQLAGKTLVTKSATPFLDLVAMLTAAGIPATDIPSKIEGVAFGKDVTLNGQTLHTIYIANDNDFDLADAGSNKFYVFGFTDNDLPGLSPQALAAVPEPAAWTTMILGLGALGFAARRRRRPAT
jgi:hypothetical protein